MDENSSPDLMAELSRENSDTSWKASQGQDEPDDVRPINKDQLFLVSLGVLMSLFT